MKFIIDNEAFLLILFVSIVFAIILLMMALDLCCEICENSSSHREEIPDQIIDYNFMGPTIPTTQSNLRENQIIKISHFIVHQSGTSAPPPSPSSVPTPLSESNKVKKVTFDFGI